MVRPFTGRQTSGKERFAYKVEAGTKGPRMTDIQCPSVRAPLRELPTRSAPAVPAASIRPSAWPPRPLLLAAWPIRTNQPIKCAHVRYRTHIHIKMVGDDIRDIR